MPSGGLDVAIESAEALGSMGACPQPSPDTQCGTVSATFHASDTADYYRWSMGNMPGGFWRCEVTNADPGMKFGLFVGYRRSGDPELPYVWMSNICPLMSEGSSCAAQILLPTYGPDPWTMYAGVWPMGGEDDCSYEYELECRLSFDEG